MPKAAKIRDDARRDTGTPAWPVLAGDTQTDWPLWRLSLVLREIAESQAPDTRNEWPLGEAPAKDTLADADRECKNGGKRKQELLPDDCKK